MLLCWLKKKIYYEHAYCESRSRINFRNKMRSLTYSVFIEFLAYEPGITAEIAGYKL